MKDKWENLHQSSRFLPKYPSEEVIRFAQSCFSKEKIFRNETKILDIGCGGGRHSLFLANEGFTTFSMDFSLSGLYETRKRFSTGNLKYQCVQGDMHKLPFKDMSFHGVLAYGTLYYSNFIGIKEAISEIFRILMDNHFVMVFTRTNRDCRNFLGERYDEKTCLIDTDMTNEKGMLNCFLSKEDIQLLFSDFAYVYIDYKEFTQNNGEVFNSDWIIVAKK